MFSSRGTVRYEERGQGYRDVEKVGKHWHSGMHECRHRVSVTNRKADANLSVLHQYDKSAK